MNIAVVCPLSSKIKNFPGCVVLRSNDDNKLTTDSEVIVFQIRTIDRSRLLNKLGEVTPEELKQIKLGLLDILKY